MPKRKGRGRPKRPILQKKVKLSADVEVATLDNPSDALEVVPGLVEEHEVGTHTVPKGSEKGEPRGSALHEKIEGSADVEEAVLDNLSTALEVDPVLLEKQEMVMPKKRGRGRPKRSTAQNFQESVGGNVSSHINASAMVEVVHEGEELEAAVIPNEDGRGQPIGSSVQNCHKNADGMDIYDNPSNMMEVSSGCKGEAEDVLDVVNGPMQRGRGRPRGSLNEKNHPQNADANVGIKRNVRGRTKELILDLKRKQSADGKLDVTIHPTKLVAVGPGRNDFIADLSIIIRQNARFNVNMWRKVSQDTRDTIVKKVLNNWRLQDTAQVQKAILDEAGRLYRNWRNRLHDYYLTFKTKEEALEHVPEDVNDSDWKFLVDYFSSPSFEIISMRNKVNKTKQRTNHTSGRKSFHAVSYDMRDPETGKEPDLQTLWKMTHVRVNGEWIDEASKEVNDKVAEQINERRCQLVNSEDGMETIEPEIVSTAFKTLVGKKSIMRDFIGGQESSNLIGGQESSNFTGVQQLQAELDAQKIETKNARKECNDMRAKLIEVESQLEQEKRKREEVEARLLDRQKDLQEIKSQVQTAIQSDLPQYLQEINSQVQTAIQSVLPQYLATTDAETSLKHKRKIEELEAQLHEAEDVITDIRSELARYRRDY